MTALLPPPRTHFTPKPVRWTCDEFDALRERGDFEGRSVILVDGEILDMPPPGPFHEMSVSLILHALQSLFMPGSYVRVQSGLPTSANTNPMPDLVVVKGSPRDYRQHPKPEVIQLVVEVSESTIRYDKGSKRHLYAAAGIPEYWVIDVENRQLHCFRDPTPDESAPRGADYRVALAFDDTASISPLAVPEKSLALAELLP